MEQFDSKRCKRIVVKYGGASLEDEQRILKAVKAIVREANKGTQIAVIVSAMGKTTDQLLQTAKNASNGRIEKRELDEILAMGERTIVRIFSAALRAEGVQSRYFDPFDPDWSIMTDSIFSDANPILGECEKRIRQHVLPLVEKNVVPVIAGFIGKTIDEKVTTLGRGGSDTTAFIFAKALQADELILVTDSEGIMSADPKIIGRPKTLEEIDIDTLVKLADSGTKFIHRKALRHKDASVKVKVIGYTSGDLNSEGTLIKGILSTELEVAFASPFPAISITVVGHRIAEKIEIVRELMESVENLTQLLGLSLNFDSVILYVSEEGNPNAPLEKMHQVIMKHQETTAMSVKRQLAFLKVKGVGLEETPGVIGKISESLRLNDINIFGLLTITSSILLFVDWNEKERAVGLINNALRTNGGN